MENKKTNVVAEFTKKAQDLEAQYKNLIVEKDRRIRELENENKNKIDNYRDEISHLRNTIASQSRALKTYENSIETMCYLSKMLESEY